MPLDFSLEVFPPKTRDGLAGLVEVSRQFAKAEPSYVSVTYGAGGSDKARSFAAIEAIRANSGMEVAAHLTCVGQAIGEVTRVVDRYKTLGVNRIVALRGDPPDGIDKPYRPHPEGFGSTDALVAAIKERGDFWVAVSAYPEVHPQSRSADHDIEVLAAKVEAGADAAITQMFFDNGLYVDYIDRVRKAGLDITVIPGVFPIHDFERVSSFAQRSGATIPAAIADRFARAALSSDPRRAGFETAVGVAAEQILELVDHGVEQVHLYTLNRDELTMAVIDEVRRALEHDQSRPRTDQQIVEATLTKS